MNQVERGDDMLVQVIRDRLRSANLSTRQASLRADLSHNTLRVVLGGARPTPTTCDALDPVLGFPGGTLRLLAGWPLPPARHQYDEDWARALLEIASVEVRQSVIRYLVTAAAGLAEQGSPTADAPLIIEPSATSIDGFRPGRIPPPPR